MQTSDSPASIYSICTETYRGEGVSSAFSKFGLASRFLQRDYVASSWINTLQHTVSLNIANIEEYFALKSASCCTTNTWGSQRTLQSLWQVGPLREQQRLSCSPLKSWSAAHNTIGKSIFSTERLRWSWLNSTATEASTEDFGRCSGEMCPLGLPTFGHMTFLNDKQQQKTNHSHSR